MTDLDQILDGYVWICLSLPPAVAAGYVLSLGLLDARQYRRRHPIHKEH